jgi:hypothetical protein
MSRKFWIAIIILLVAAVFGVAKWVREVHDEDDELWDFEAERLPDQALASALAEKRREGWQTKELRARK